MAAGVGRFLLRFSVKSEALTRDRRPLCGSVCAYAEHKGEGKRDGVHHIWTFYSKEGICFSAG